jgi:type VI secretion system protein ImpL
VTPVLRAALLRWCWTLVGGLSLAGIVWFLGPLLPGLETARPRLGLVLFVLAAAVGTTLLLERRRRRRETALTGGIAGAGAAQEADAVRAKIATALSLLKRARGRRGALDEQPWYAIIGPPGAGKTTALLNAGLDFPLAAELGPGALAGVGGTRLCEWWFTGDAVLIDTAGRYTTQDSDAQVDRAGWDAFLDLLRRTRPRQPLNGVIVAIALSDIAHGSAEQRALHAGAVRRRIGELETRFGMRLPVYALFTKCDLIAGFMEFFDDLDRERRGQVWGMTFPLAAAGAGAVAGFAEGFRLLAERLELRLFERLQAERNPERRTLIAGFPAQIASLETPLAGFLEDAFGGTKADPAPLLRGVYFTSATQEGTPIDRLGGLLARTFGLTQPRAARQRPEAGRSYFLTRLLRDVVFNEAMLVSENPARRRRRLALRTVAFASLAVLAVAAVGVLLQARAASRQAIEASLAALAAYEQSARGLPLDPVADADLSALLPLLDRAGAIRPGDGCAAGPAGRWLGLCQDGKLAAGARTLYRHALAYALFPRLIWRLEAQMRGNLGQPDFLYEASRIYLMLGGAGPLDRDLVREWMALDWRVAYPGAGFAALREAMARHLDALLAEPLPPVQLDGELVAQARATFGRVTLAQRVYARIRPSAAAQRLPPWRPDEALGAAGAGLFVRASDRPLSEGIAGFYTVEGFHKVLLPSLGRAVQQVVAESWVLGQRIALDPNGEPMRALQRDVVALYESDYAQLWDQMMADLDLAPFRSLAQAAQGLYILAHPESPLRRLLAAMSRQLSLSVPPSLQTPALGGAPAPGLSDTQLRLQALLGVRPPADSPPARPGHEIDDHYEALRKLAGGGGGAGTPLDQALKTLADLQQQLAKLAAAPLRSGPVAVPAADDPALALRAEARRQPQPLARWLASIAASGIALRSGDARQQIVAVFNGSNGPAELCAAAVNGRYPFVPGATGETSLDDFTRLFAPGGVIDGFFNTLLKPYVDTSGKVWKLQSADGVAVALPAADLAQFQRAALIRDLFFTGGRTVASFRFDIAPVSLDAHAARVTLDLDGTVLAYGGGPPRPAEITWPGRNLIPTARLAFEPPPAAGPGAWQESGPWSMFRLFSRGRLQSSATGGKYTLTFQLGERQAVFDIGAGAASGPLAAGTLQGFRCPSVQ